MTSPSVITINNGIYTASFCNEKCLLAWLPRSGHLNYNSEHSDIDNIEANAEFMHALPLRAVELLIGTTCTNDTTGNHPIQDTNGIDWYIATERARANQQGLDLPIPAKVTNLGGNCMALETATDNNYTLVITNEAVCLYDTLNPFDEDEPEPVACVMIYAIKAENVSLSTPWWIHNTESALYALAECVVMNLDRLEYPENYESEASDLLTEAIAETCAYAIDQINKEGN